MREREAKVVQMVVVKEETVVENLKIEVMVVDEDDDGALKGVDVMVVTAEWWLKVVK